MTEANDTWSFRLVVCRKRAISYAHNEDRSYSNWVRAERLLNLLRPCVSIFGNVSEDRSANSCFVGLGYTTRASFHSSMIGMLGSLHLSGLFNPDICTVKSNKLLGIGTFLCSLVDSKAVL